MTTLRQAILQAADHLELHPETYDFMSVHIPSCGTPGCVIGWVGYFLGVDPGKAIGGEFLYETPIMGVSSHIFYTRLDAFLQPRSWIVNASIAAATLRKYADLYHPEETQPEVQSYPEVRRELERIAAASKTPAHITA